MRAARRVVWALAAVFAAGTDAGIAQDPDAPAAPLTVEEVLDRTAAGFPAILEALAKRRAAAGDALSTKGAFDLVFESDGFSRRTGAFDGNVVENRLRQPIGPLGGEIFGQYRVASGNFPIYENIFNTNSGGELKIGVLFSLLRDRAIDERRFKIGDARLALQEADFDVQLTRIGVQQQALSAYWRWVTTGRALLVYRELLAIAEARQSGLESQVRRGERAEIFLTENLQNITRRQSLTAEGERDFAAAQNRLAFYLSASAGPAPALGLARVPPLQAAERVMAETLVDPMAMGDFLLRRPELAILRTSLERARNLIDLRENALLPRLDLKVEGSSEFGDVGEGGSTFGTDDTIIGFEFSVPFQRRAAKGRLRAAEAQEEALRHRRRLTEERIAMEVRDIIIELNTSRRLLELARQEVEQAEIMREAELNRFREGASDFFLVNIREERAADARIRYHGAELAARLARADYDAAIADFERLRIDAQAAGPALAPDDGWAAEMETLLMPENAAQVPPPPPALQDE